MLRVPIRSRWGNGVLGFLGIVYFVSAIALLVGYIASTWGAASLTDIVLQFGLIVTAIGGLLFILIAVQNLRSAPARSRSPRDHQTTAAGAS